LKKLRTLALLGSALGALLVGPPASAQSRELTERESEIARGEAKSTYERAVRAYKSARYRDAIELFSAADRLAPRAALSFDVARAYDQLGDGRAALRCYREYLRRSPSAINRDAVQQRIGELESRLAGEGVQQVTVISEPSPAAVQIDGREVGVTPWTSELSPGKHRVALSRAGYSPIFYDVELPRERALLVQVSLSPLRASEPSDGSQAERIAAGPRKPPVQISAEPMPMPAVAHSGPSPVGWAALGIGGASLIGAGVFELLRHSAQEDARNPDTSQLRAVERRDASETYQTTARVLAGAGVGSLVVGSAVLLLTSGRSSEEHSLPGTTASLSCGPANCGVGLMARFQ
jgi:tetratricopeptide (TPR) repeat protein